MIFNAASTTSPADGTAGFILIAAFCIYFFPSIIAIFRRVHVLRVIVINVFFGWTLIGWVSALISACATKVYLYPPQITINQVAPTPVQVAPGWYNNPHGPGQLYWNGSRWND